MSHFVVLVFHDQTDEFRKEYDEELVEIIKRPDGSWVFAHSATDDDRAAQIAPVSVKFSELYSTFEEFCEKWHDTEPNEQGRYGYWASIPQTRQLTCGAVAGVYVLKADAMRDALESRKQLIRETHYSDSTWHYQLLLDFTNPPKE